MMIHSIRSLVAVAFMLGIQACDPFDDQKLQSDDIVFDGQSSLRLQPPDILTSSRKIELELLAVDVVIAYSVSGNDYSYSQKADRTGNMQGAYWQLGMDVPSNIPFVLSMTWFEDGVERLDLIRLTRKFEGFSSNGRAEFAYEFSPDGEYSKDPEAPDFAGFNNDGDFKTNLEERREETDPFDRNNPIVIDDPTPRSLLADPEMLDLIATSGSGTEVVNLINPNSFDRTFTATSDSVNWLTLQPVSGTIPANASILLNATYLCGTEESLRTGTISVLSEGFETLVDFQLNCSEVPAPLLNNATSELTLNATVMSSATGIVQFSNSGAEVLNYTLSSDSDWLLPRNSSGVVQPGNTERVDIAAACRSTVERRIGELKIRSDGGNTDVAVILDCTPPPPIAKLEIRPVLLNLTAITDRTASSSTVLTNTGTATLVYKLVSDSNWLSADPEGGSIESGKSATVGVVAQCADFTGTRSGKLSASSNGGDEVVEVNLICAAIEPPKLSNVSSPVNLTAPVTQSTSGTLSFENSGGSPLSYKLGSSAQWLSVAEDQGTLASGKTALVTLTGTCGSDVGKLNGSLSLTSDGGNTDVAVVLDCTPPPPIAKLEIRPVLLNLTAITDQNASSSTVLTNTGTATLVYKLVSDSNWLSADPEGGSIESGKSATVGVVAQCADFTGTRSGKLSASSNGGDEVVEVNLICTAIEPPKLSNVSSPVNLTAPVTQSTSGTLSFENSGGSPLSYKLGSNAQWLSVAEDQGTLASGKTALVTLTGTCGSDVGTLDGSLSLTSNGGNDTVPVSLICQGAVLSDVSPLSLSLTAIALQTAQGTLSFSNTGNDIMTFDIKSDSDWLCPDDSVTGECQTGGTTVSGRLLPQATYSLSVVAKCPAEEGTLNGSLDLSGNFDTARIPVELTCRPVPLEPVDVRISYVQTKTYRFDWTDRDGATYYQLLESVDGISKHVAVSPRIRPDVQRYDHSVALHLRDKSSYVLQTCNANECVDSVDTPVKGNLVGAIGYIKGLKGTGFGEAMDISGDGNTLAVFHGKEGAVSIYRMSESTEGRTDWNLDETINIDAKLGTNSYSPYSISLNYDGNRLAVGLPEAPNPDAYCECNPGAVLILVRNAQSFVETSSVQSLRPIWTEEDRLFDPQSSQSNEFGSSVALDKSGSRVLVGSPGSSEVHEFAADGDIWYQIDIIRPPGGDPSTGDEESTVDFGRYLQMSANLETLIVSADVHYFNDSINNAVYVYRGGESWAREAVLFATNNNPEPFGCKVTYCSDGFGLSLAVSGDGEIVAVGAPNEESKSSGVNGDQQDNSLGNAGAAYVFIRNFGKWNQEAYIKASNPADDDFFGYSIDLDFTGKLLAVGAWEEASRALGFGGDETDDIFTGAGAGYLFSQGNGSWRQATYFKASKDTINVGEAIRISDDGQSLFMSSAHNDELFYY